LKLVYTPKNGHRIGKRLAVISSLLFIPLAALAYFYVNQLNSEVVQTREALEGLRWSSRLNQTRLPLYEMRSDNHSDYELVEESVQSFAEDLYDAGIFSKNDRKHFGKNSENWESAPIGGLTWRLQSLSELNRAAEKIFSVKGH
jgi:hypothetical protein